LFGGPNIRRNSLGNPKENVLVLRGKEGLNGGRRKKKVTQNGKAQRAHHQGGEKS